MNRTLLFLTTSLLIIAASVLTAISTRADDTTSKYVRIQANAPGILQVGNSNISGTGIFGSIGVGTSSPVRPLHVSTADLYNARFDGTNAGRTALELRSSASNTTWEAGVTGSSPSYNLPVGVAYLYRQGANEIAMFIRPDGFVGIPGTIAIGSTPYGEATIVAHDITGIGAASHFHSLTTGPSVGVGAISDGTNGAAGLAALSSSTTGVNYGVWARSASPDGYGVFSQGVLGASGTKEFRIDHPEDPTNKYLIHYSAEGPEPLLIYCGTARLDSSGRTVVRLPHYYDEIAKDARIQLTPAGAPMPNLYASETVSGGEFSVAGGKAGGKVYWEVKAVRNDAWVRTYGAPVEIEKPVGERGTYQHPELYGKTSCDPMTKRLQCKVDESTH